MKSVLTVAEWTEFESWWMDEKANRNPQLPPELVRYVEWKKHRYGLAQARYEKSAARRGLAPNDRTCKRLSEEADSERERLLEYLKEQLSVNAELVMWLVHQAPHDSVEGMIEAGDLPHVITSRTAPGGKRTPMGATRKRELKIRALENAIESESPQVQQKTMAEIVKRSPAKRKRDFSGFKV